MATLKATWLPGGEVELAPLPLTGERELKALSAKFAELHAIAATERYIAFAGGILAARRVLAKLGPAKAKESWDDYVLLNLKDWVADLIVPLDQFEAHIAANRDRLVIQQLAVATDEEAMEKLKEMAAEKRKEMEKFNEASLVEMAKRPLLELYWRLRASRVKRIVTIGGEVDLPWKPNHKDDQDAIIVMLGDVVSQADIDQLRDEEERRPTDMEEFKPRTAADVRGKSSPTSVHLTPSKPSSGPSSAPTTETQSTSG